MLSKKRKWKAVDLPPVDTNDENAVGVFGIEELVDVQLVKKQNKKRRLVSQTSVVARKQPIPKKSIERAQKKPSVNARKRENAQNETENAQNDVENSEDPITEPQNDEEEIVISDEVYKNWTPNTHL